MRRSPKATACGGGLYAGRHLAHHGAGPLSLGHQRRSDKLLSIEDRFHRGSAQMPEPSAIQISGKQLVAVLGAAQVLVQIGRLAKGE